MAPEVIRGDSYDGRCDWWSVGIIIFECLYGKHSFLVQAIYTCANLLTNPVLLGFTPFACEDRHKTKLKILKHKESLKFPNELLEVSKPPSVEALDIISRLLVEKEHRLCSRRYELNDYTRKTYGVWHNSYMTSTC